MVMILLSNCPPPMGYPPAEPNVEVGLVRAMDRDGKGGAVGGRPAGKEGTPGDTGDASVVDGGNNLESGEDG